MTREEAARIINECKDKGFKHTFYTLNEYHTALDMAIQALKREPCKDVISREAVISTIYDNKSDFKNDFAQGFFADKINGLPPVTIQPNKWIFVSERMPNNHEYIKNNGLFNVSDENRSYFGWFDFYNTKKFVKPTIAGFRVDNAVIAWMSLPQPYKQEVEE